MKSLLICMCAALVACLPGPFGPPSVPAHDVLEDGVLHARGKDTPYLCVDTTGKHGPCPEQRPSDARLSCDSSGCHGTFDYVVSIDDAERNVRGDNAPSCWICHDREWNERKR
jgi:hypothetical protein